MLAYGAAVVSTSEAVVSGVDVLACTDTPVGRYVVVPTHSQ